MAFETYNELLTMVKDWANRRDITDDKYYNFIFFAGNLANQTLRVPAMENTLILDVSVDGQVVIPFDFLELRSLTANFDSDDSVPLQRVAWDQFVNYRATDIQISGDRQPRYFGRQGSYWFLTPVPDPSISPKVTCHYYRAIPDINVGEPTNWLSMLSPMTYLFGALHYLYLYLMDDERAEYWLNKFDNELARIQKLADDGEYSGTSLSIKAKTEEGEL